MTEIAVQVLSREGTPTIEIHRTADLPVPGPNQVLIGFLASPIHPLDLLVLAGKYPVKPKFRHVNDEGDDEGAIPGYDGIAQVLSVGPPPTLSSPSTTGTTSGSSGTELVPGDFVIPSIFGLGTWRSHAIVDSSLVMKISPPPQDLIGASMIRLAVAPGYFLVEDVVSQKLKPGDTIIINAGTSAVAHFVGQFARLRGVGVVHVVRDRSDPEDMEEVRSRLLDSGAEAVITESELIAGKMKCTGTGTGTGTGTRDGRRSRRIVMAIDAVFGGAGSVALRDALCEGGTYVQLGFLSGGTPQNKVELGPGELFGRRLTMVGFRGSDRWAARTPEERTDLVNWWVDLFNRGILTRPALGLDLVQWVPGRLDENGRGRLRDAVRRAQAGGLGQRKQVLVFVDSDVKDEEEEEEDLD